MRIISAGTANSIGGYLERWWSLMSAAFGQRTVIQLA